MGENKEKIATPKGWSVYLEKMLKKLFNHFNCKLINCKLEVKIGIL